MWGILLCPAKDDTHVGFYCLPTFDPQWLALSSEPHCVHFESDVAFFCLGVFWFFSLCNVFNFMDGIDGIGTTQSIIIASLSLHVSTFDSIIASQLWIFVASLIGFPYSINLLPRFLWETLALFLWFFYCGFFHLFGRQRTPCAIRVGIALLLFC